MVTAAALALIALQQPVDTAYTAAIRRLTSEPRFNTELTDHLPADPRVPTPFQVLGYVPGTVGRLSYVADITRYFRALAAASPRVRVFDIGKSDGGRPMIIAAIADSATLTRLDRYRGITAALADPRGVSADSAQALIAAGKPLYWASGSIHSPETGSPEMLMELAYRLAVEESPFIRMIRDSVITLITPVTEVDGRDRMVDVYRYRKAHHNVAPGLIYWGKYTAHDNNRDGIVMSQVLTRTMMETFFGWHPTVLHDLHESVPFLYTSTGTGPYNRELDPIVVDEWHELAYQEITELTRRGLPGVWTHNFYDGWVPNYMFWVANGHNSIGRFYETYTSRGADCHTVDLPPSATSIEWYRPNPPLNGVRWCIRNNINYQQSALLIALNYMARNGHRYLEQFYRKGVRAIDRGRATTGGGPNAYLIPANQPRPVEAANLVNLLRFHGIEVRRADTAFTAGAVAVAAGDYVVTLDQPYGPLAKSYFSRQDFGADDPRPYDDTGWTVQLLRNIVVRAIADTAVLHRPMSKVDHDVRVRGRVSGDGTAAFVVAPTTETNLIQFRIALRDVRMFASEDSFGVGGVRYGRGSTIVPVTAGTAGRIRTAAESLGLVVAATGAVPEVRRHELDLPRIGLVHSWLNTQNEGWVRYAFDAVGIPYTYLSVQQLKDRVWLRRFDVLVLPYVTENAQLIVNGLPLVGPKIPWRRTTETPNLGSPDSTDDVRPGIGLDGIGALADWIRAGGVLLTEGGTSAVLTTYGITRGVDITPSRQLRATGGIYRAVTKDAASPIAYGYPDTLAVYFNQSPLFQVDTSSTAPEDQDSSITREQNLTRPRVVLAFHPKRDSLRLSGLLVAGEELAGRPAVVDAPVGRGHVVLFAIRPFWRWSTQGSFALAFNTLLNWNDLSVDWPTTLQPAKGAVAAGEDDQGP